MSGPLSEMQQRGLIALLAVALVALGVPLAWPTRVPLRTYAPHVVEVEGIHLVALEFLGPPGPVDVNRATAVELETLPGIGPVLAQRIVEERERGGPFARIEELTRVSGIGDATCAALRGLAVAGEEATEAPGDDVCQ